MAISSAVSPSAVARVVGIKTTFKDFRNGSVVVLPQRVALVGQGATLATYATTKAQVTSALEVAQTYGFGSPLHLAAMQLFPLNGDGIGSIPLTVYPLVDDGAGVAAVGDITIAGAATEAASFIVRINNMDAGAFVISVGDTVTVAATAAAAAINAALDLPVTATSALGVVTLTSKWEGVSANDIYVEVIGSTTAGSTFAVTQPVGGLVNPDIDAALAQVGDVWETLFVNCLDIADTVTLGKYDTFGEGRWGALTRKPYVAFTGNTEADRATAVAVPDARKTDRTNVQLVAPGSNDLPFAVAARQVARIATAANDDPAMDYGSQNASGLTPGADGDQWTYVDRDAAVKAGSSTIQVKDGVVNLSDIVTFYHPDGDPLPAYRYVVDIVKLQNIIFNIDLVFATSEWDGAPLIPDNQPTANRNARKPRTAVTAAARVLDSLGLAAIISDPETAKASVQAEIDGANPKRLNMVIPVQLSGNANIISIDLDFGFYFGTPQLVA